MNRLRNRLMVKPLEDRAVPAMFFGEPFNLGSGVNTAGFHDSAPTVTSDGLGLLMMRCGEPANSLIEILEATRNSSDVPFGNVVSAGAEVNSGSYKSHPDVSPDGLSLLYCSEDGSGLFQATRSARNQPFGGVTSLGILLPGQRIQSPSLSADSLTLFFTAWDTGNVQNDIYQATRPTMNDPWGTVTMLGSAINVPGYNDAQPSISSDGLKLFFNSNRPGGFGLFDLYVATRPSLEAPWEPAVNLGPQVNTAYDDKGPEISPDGGMLYFHSNRPGGFGLQDLYAVTVGHDSPAAPTISISDAPAIEGNASGGAQFTVTLSSASSLAVSVNFATQSATAQTGSDFAANSGTLTFAPGQTSQTIPVQIINDSTIELNETFAVVLSSPTNAVIADNTGVGTIIDDDTKFYVVNDESSADKTFEYGSGSGSAGENYALSTGNTAPRGIASTIAGDKVWVVDANKTVYVYNASGNLLGSWSVSGLTGAAQVEGITTNGADIWIVDAKQDRVYRYAGAATRLSGSQNATSNFALNRGNKNPNDLVTDGTSIWVVDDATTDKVFKYTLSGLLLGSWTLTGGGASPTGITLDPSNVQQHLWVVDRATDRVYQYDNARSRTSGSQAAGSNFALAAANTNPQGIADPPVTFGTPFNLGSGVNTAGFHDSAPTVTADGLSLLLMRYGEPANSPIEILEATRNSTGVPFENVVSAGAEVNFGSYKSHPDVSPDGLTLWYCSEDGNGLFQATRQARNQPFSGVTSLGSLLPGQRKQSPSLSADGLTLFFTAWDTGNVQNDIYQATRPTMNDQWGNVAMLGSGISVPGSNDAQPSISSDGLKIFFNSNRPGGLGNFDIYVATRPSLQAPWEPAVNIGPQVNTAFDDKGAEISPDGGLLYFHSNRPGGFGLEDLYGVTVYETPAVQSVQVSDGAAQRSRITNLSITFNQQVTFNPSMLAAFTLTKNGGGSVGFSALSQVINGGTRVTLSDFTGPETESGSLRDGNYTLTALASQISANGQPMAANHTFNFHRFYGDMNGDRRVDISDFGYFSLAYLQTANYSPALDFNNDGRIDIADFGQFSVRYFTSLP